MHYGLMALVGVEGPILWPHIVLNRFGDRHVSNEGRIGSQSGLFNLVANGAGNSVCGCTVSFGKFLQWKASKHLRLPSGIPVCNMDRRHMANRALILDDRLRLRMIDGLAPYATLPVGIPRRVGHDARPPLRADGDVLART